MPDKLTVVANLSDKNYTKTEVTHLINSICFKVPPPITFKRGDVIRADTSKPRPTVIINIIGDLVYTIPLTSTEDSMNLCKSNSRFFNKDGKQMYFSHGILVYKIAYAMDNFLGVYDDNKSLRLAIKELKTKMQIILK